MLTVTELTRRLKGAVEPAFLDVWVSGEVGNLRRQSSGHVYFGLKDAEASVDAVLWASSARKVKFDLRDGTEVVARGRIEIYAPRGRYQLVVQEVEPRGAGARALALQQLRERLAAEGLLDQARKRPLPFLPACIGVATSTSGAALQDFLRVVHGRFPGARVVVAGCRVQGDGAAATVIAALRLLVDFGVDVAVVTRGGGSADDLWEFNDEALARAIAACPAPVVSAVGHEVDVSVADLVADVRAATPTHAAEVVVPVRDDLLASLSALRGRLVRAEGNALGERRRVLRALRAELSDPRRVLSDQRRRLDEALHRVAAWSSSTFRRESMRVAGLAARLEPANVGRILTRGFALALRDGRPLRSSREAAPGDPVRVVLGEGWLDARVESRDQLPHPIPGLPARTEEA